MGGGVSNLSLNLNLFQSSGDPTKKDFKKNFYKKYEIARDLGCGAFSEVKLGLDKVSY